MQYAAEYQTAHQRAGRHSEFLLNKRADGTWCIQAKSKVCLLRVCISCAEIEVVGYPLVEQRITTTYSVHPAFGIFCADCALTVQHNSDQMAECYRRTMN